MLDARHIVLSVLLVGGCGGGQKDVKSCEPAKTTKVTIVASDRVNADDEGRSLPIVVRLYQLKDLGRLETAEFEDIWLRAEETLEADLVKFDELTLYPSQRSVKSIELGDGVGYLVAVALFRKPAGLSWRAIYEVPASPCTADGRSVALAPRFFLEDYRIDVELERRKQVRR